MWLVILAILFILLFGGLIWSVLKHSLKFTWALLINAVLGLITIFLLNFLGFGIPINLITIIISAIFGLLGVTVLAVLALLGIL